MAQVPLELDQIKAGAELVQAVRDRGIVVQDAYWRYDSEAESWNLVFVAPQVLDRGPLGVIQVVNDILGAADPPGPVDLFDIRVDSPLDRLAHAVEAFQGRHPAPLATRIRSGLISGEYVPGLYLYPRTRAS